MTGASGADSIPKTPQQVPKTYELLAAGGPNIRKLQNSVSPQPNKNAGCLMNQNEWRKNPSEEWKMNTSGTNDFKKATTYGRI